MELISELESFRRNVYGGGIGFYTSMAMYSWLLSYVSAFFEKTDKDKQLSKVFIQAGAGIVL